MSSIPSNLARVPNVLASHLMLGSVTRASLDLLDLQVKMSSGKQMNRPSDDAIGASTVSVLDDVIERRDQRLRNLSHAESVLNNVDAGLADISTMLIEAKGVASSQIGVGSDEETRRNQAGVIDAMILEATRIANRTYQDVHLFGGNATARTPIVELRNGLRYRGEGEGLLTDVGLTRGVPITVAGEKAFGVLSTRVEGDRDLDPVMSGATRLADLGGARGLGVTLGTVNVQVGATDLTVDLTGAHTVQDVLDRLQTEIQTVDPGAAVSIDPSGNRIFIDPSAGVTVTIADPATDATAADLGINLVFPDTGAAGGDVDPRVTELTPISDLTGVTTPLGMIRLSNAGQTRDVDLSAVETVEDLVNIVEGLDLGIRVEINADADRLDFVNELSGGSMSIAEVAGGTTATELGVRSLTGSTLLADFNEGLGVQIRSGSVDPVTGMPDPAADEDFSITTKDGTTFAVDLDLALAVTVQDVLDAINAAAAGAGLTVGPLGTDDFNASLADDGNGLMITDRTLPLGNPTVVTPLNGSYAATDLGFAASSTGATLVGEDRATVAVDSLFTHLMSLRDALLANDERGITLAGEKLDGDISRVTGTRAEVGVRARRVSDAAGREEDLRIQDTSLRSQFEDLDFTEAALRFGLLQQQLQAGLATAGNTLNLSLLDFLG